MDVNEMRASRDKAVVAFIKFTQYKKYYASHMFCFYEGEDIKYYESRIDTICGIPFDKIIAFNCGGKVGVKKVYKLIYRNSAYSYVNKAFFIDKDYFPSEIDSDDMFETPCYAVENLYTSVNVFERVLKREFGMNILDSDFEKCRNAYIERYEEFHDCVLELNAWLKCQRKRDIENGHRGIQINLKVGRYFETLTLDEVKLKIPINKEFLEKQYTEAPIIDNEELDEVIEEFKNINQQQFFRGKFEMEFMVKMIMDLRAKHKDGGYLSGQYECVKIDAAGNPLTILSRDADTPSELVDFLQRYKSTKCDHNRVS